MPDPCPCGGATYAACCEPYHRGAEPADAPTLMRSRYAAFARKDVPYLWRTLHRDHDDRQGSYEAFAAGMRRHFAGNPRYVGLAVLASTPPDAEGISTVTFRAELRVRGKDASFTERSLFADDGTGLRYLVGAPP